MRIVEIYTKTTCPYCWRAKHLLNAKGVEYREIVVDFGGPEKQAQGRTVRERSVTTAGAVCRLTAV